MAQSFHSSIPDRHASAKMVNGRLLTPELPPLQVEIPDMVPDDAINFNIRSLIHVDPIPVCEELQEFHWDKILDLSDGFWNEKSSKGILHPEANMALPEDTLLGFNESLRYEFLEKLRRRGVVVVKITGAGAGVGRENNCQAYFVGKTLEDIIGRIQVHKIMAS